MQIFDSVGQGDILHQMNDAWTDPSAMSEPVLAIGDMKGDESLGEAMQQPQPQHDADRNNKADEEDEEDMKMEKSDTT